MSEREGLVGLYSLNADESHAMSPTARRLQIVSELLFLLAAFYVGLTARSPWLILALGVISTIAYAAQHGGLWREASKTGSRLLVLRGVFGTFLVQTALVGALYLAGLGLWTLVNNSGAVLGLRGADLIGLGILLAIAIISGFLAGWFERRGLKDNAEKSA